MTPQITWEEKRAGNDYSVSVYICRNESGTLSVLFLSQREGEGPTPLQLSFADGGQTAEEDLVDFLNAHKDYIVDRLVRMRSNWLKPGVLQMSCDEISGRLSEFILLNRAS
jgi:hypothetical protein